MFILFYFLGSAGRKARAARGNDDASTTQLHSPPRGSAVRKRHQGGSAGLVSRTKLRTKPRRFSRWCPLRHTW